MPALPPLPPRPDPSAKREPPPRPATAKASPARSPGDSGPRPRPAKPDARPMRVVYGAGAVAAMSVMAVGLVQPDFAASADQPAESATDVAWLDPTAAPPGSSQRDAWPARQQADVRVRHVIRYVHLKPGQTAPPGATVIQPDAPAPRVVVTRTQPQPPRSTTGNQPAPRTSAPQPPAPRATRPPAPAPTPVKTRQSGKKP